MQQISSAAFSDTKPHYELLDGLRGVAALLVVWYLRFQIPNLIMSCLTDYVV